MSEAVTLRRINPDKNMARFYALSLQPTLFGEVALVREWGRIGQGGRVAITAYPSSAEAAAALDRFRRKKVRRGYELANHKGTLAVAQKL